jgi:hypothetical protein
LTKISALLCLRVSDPADSQQNIERQWLASKILRDKELFVASLRFAPRRRVAWFEFPHIEAVSKVHLSQCAVVEIGRLSMPCGLRSMLGDEKILAQRTAGKFLN